MQPALLLSLPACGIATLHSFSGSMATETVSRLAKRIDFCAATAPNRPLIEAPLKYLPGFIALLEALEPPLSRLLPYAASSHRPQQAHHAQCNPSKSLCDVDVDVPLQPDSRVCSRAPPLSLACGVAWRPTGSSNRSTATSRSCTLPSSSPSSPTSSG